MTKRIELHVSVMLKVSLLQKLSVLHVRSVVKPAIDDDDEQDDTAEQNQWNRHHDSLQLNIYTQT